MSQPIQQIGIQSQPKFKRVTATDVRDAVVRAPKTTSYGVTISFQFQKVDALFLTI